MVRVSKDVLLKDALELPAGERAEMARELIASLDGPADGDVEEAWAAEVERRLRQVDEGTAVLEDWDSVHQRILTQLRSIPPLMRVALHRDASAELAAVAEWYERQRPQLGEDLLAEANRCIGLIAANPETWPAWGKALRPGVRQFLLTRFPYRVIYVLRPDHVLVIAFAHTRRDPGYWLRRVP